MVLSSLKRGCRRKAILWPIAIRQQLSKNKRPPSFLKLENGRCQYKSRLKIAVLHLRQAILALTLFRQELYFPDVEVGNH